MTYFVEKGIRSNTAKGNRFQTLARKKILKKYGKKIAFFKEEYYIPEMKVTIDFFIALKNGQQIFIECKYRNGNKGEGIGKQEAMFAALTYAFLVKIYCQRNNIDYKYYIYTNGVPKPRTACALWLKEINQQYDVIHDIVGIDKCEKTIENATETNNLEDIIYG